ncbi:MAG TPA: hypothetical protein GX530_08585 [Corynebacteriales bacterium]|nr:hypothetical protein [Mycobacteriales bacterium]
MSEKGLFAWLRGPKKRSCCFNVRIEEMTGEEENKNHNELESKTKDAVKTGHEGET